jgi:hypothetical protein
LQALDFFAPTKPATQAEVTESNRSKEVAVTLTRCLCNALPIFRQCFVAAGSFFIAFLWPMVFANARDLGQWGYQDPATRKWFNSLMLPGDHATSCCGKSDAYWADNFDSKDGQYVAIITDPRPDGPLGRAHIEQGTRIRIIWGKGKNPTGHGWVFILDNIVFCYLPPEGI